MIGEIRSKFKVCLNSERFDWVIFIFLLLIYWKFSLKVHTWESYFYAGGIEGFLDIREVFLFKNRQLSESLNSFELLPIFHPNHPLLHFLIFLFYSFFKLLSIEINTLSLVSFLNSIAGAFGGMIFYRILRDLKIEKLLAISGALLLGFSDIFWYQALSGEVYAFPILFILLSLWYCQKYVVDRNFHEFSFALIFFCIAFSFHLMAIFFAVPFVFGLIILNKSEKNFLGNEKFELMKHLKIGGMVSILFFVFFYVLPIIIILERKTVNNLVDIFFIYSGEFGFWNKAGGNLVSNIATGFSYFSKSFVGHESVRYIAYVVTLPLFIFQFFMLGRKDVFLKLLSVSFFTYFFLIVFLLNLPNVVDYWIFAFVPFLLGAIIMLDRMSKRSRWFVMSFSIFCFLANSIFDIYPKALLIPEDYFVASKLGTDFSKVDKYLVLSSLPFTPKFIRQAWHILRKNKNGIFLHAGFNDKELRNLLKKLEAGKKILILTDMGQKVFEGYLKSLGLSNEFTIHDESTFKVIEAEGLDKVSVGKIEKTNDWVLRKFSLSF